MALTLNLKTPIAAEPMTLAEAKNFLRVDLDDDDAFISSLVSSARDYCESATMRALGTESFELVLEDFPSDRDFIEIPRPPLQNIISAQYKDCYGVMRDIDPETIILDYDSEPGRIVLAYNRFWPIYIPWPAGAVIINFTAGYNAANPMPEGIKQAMYLLIGQWYTNREPMVDRRLTELNYSVDALLQPHRVITLEW
ncbi:phage gp6-like head-tail connector protein [Desulfosporosinus acididurans]|uniref:Phage gp6-like head-tail connector protein n=1 Tax=Desulfosporosinus acididurans TaxID=476652 RepID=A0A0J1FKW6_9FIRM|nr:head-tail connector protein [Desulfosporosinus acididurans]KLU64022.1 phage gp6-like head-tail connector protein [Desulfosporosinus acididurans]